MEREREVGGEINQYMHAVNVMRDSGGGGGERPRVNKGIVDNDDVTTVAKRNGINNTHGGGG